MKLAALLLLLAAAAPARAILPSAQSKTDARRFAFHQRRKPRPDEAASADKATYDYNHKGGGMTPAAAGAAFSRGALTPVQAALQLLGESRVRLGIDPSTLVLDRQAGAPGHKHLLFRQTYKGLPVEFSYVKVHLADNGAALGIDTNYEKGLSLDVAPSIGAAQAASAAKADSGAAKTGPASLVILPDPQGGPARLAWKLAAQGGGGDWRYYVDARTGQVLFRADQRRSICGTSGNMSAMIYDQDPQATPLAVRGLPNMYVFQGDQNTFAVTDKGGNYCGAGIGKVFTSFQGPYINVSRFNGPSAHYDNGKGVWSTIATPVSSPHPYPAADVLIATVDLRGVIPPGAVKVLPVFSNFKVGAAARDAATEGGDITVDDQLAILDSSGNPVGGYLGGPVTFNGQAVNGQLMYLRLKSSSNGGGQGYDVSLSSYLTLTAPYVDPGVGESHIWYATDTPVGLRSEFNLFYHLNLMHDFFMFGTGQGGASLYGNDGSGNQLPGVDITSAAYIGKPMNALALAGPDISNPFYDPDFDDIFFGDVSDVNPSDALTDDATVPRHEYTHYVVAKIWNNQPFGESQAIEEGIADYFSGTSLNDPSIGLYAIEALGGGNIPLRELDSAGPADTCGATPAVLNASTWSGEVHCDGRFFSQSLWDIRKARVALQTLGPGRACADGLVFQSLLFFPESFSEFINAMLKVDALGLVPACAVGACGGNAKGCVNSTINAAFNFHGLQSVGGTNDPYDTVLSRNDGFETAVDVATIPVVAGTIYPAGDIDFFTFPSGPGPVVVTLDLPPDPVNPGLYKAYMMTLFDAGHHQLAQVSPAYDGVNDVGGFCGDTDCTTSQRVVTLAYTNRAPTQLYVEINGGITFAGNSNSGVNSTNQYVVAFQYPHNGAITGGVLSAAFDNDVFSYEVNVTTWVRSQDYSFAYAQLRDHNAIVIPNTLTHVPPAAGDWLVMLTSANALGTISGTLQLQKGFAARHPALGTVSLEVFAYDTVGSTVSVGQSEPFNLTTNETQVTAYNNIFNPNLGQRATIKYEIQQPGHVTLRLYTINGNYISTLLDNDEPAGKGSVDWAGVNVNGNTVASGVYLLYMRGPGVSKTQKIVVVK